MKHSALRLATAALIAIWATASVNGETIQRTMDTDFAKLLAGCWVGGGHVEFADGGGESEWTETLCFESGGILSVAVDGYGVFAEGPPKGEGKYWFANDRLYLEGGGESEAWPFENGQSHCNAVIRLQNRLDLTNCLNGAGAARDYSFYAAAQSLPVDDRQLSGCWDMRDTKEEIERRSEDPYYASEVRYCFNEEGPGQLTIRASEFSGYRDDTGNWVNAGGDGWDEGNTYEVAGDQIRIDDNMSVEVCRYTLEGNILTLAQCVIEGSPNRVPIEDTVYDRAAS